MTPTATGVGLGPGDVLSVGHQATRTGAPMVQLALARWVARHHGRPPRLIEMAGGTLEGEFAALGATVLGPLGSRRWMVERGLAELDRHRLAAVAATLRHGPAFARHRDVAVVHLSSVGSALALRFVPAGRRVVTHCHELGPTIDEVLSEAMWARLVDATTTWIAVSDAVAVDLVARGVRPGAVVRHPEMIDPPHPDPGATAEVRARLGVRPGELVVGMVGTTHWRKGPDLFLRLAAALRRRRPDLAVRFVWVGGASTGPELWPFEHDVARAGLGEVVSFVGEVEDPAPWFAAFDVFCLTSREDPFPLVCLEAMALGVPVVSFASGGMEELAVAGGGPNLVVVPCLDVEAMAEAVSALAADDARRGDLAGRGQAWVRAHHLTEQVAPALWATVLGTS